MSKKEKINEQEEYGIYTLDATEEIKEALKKYIIKDHNQKDELQQIKSKIKSQQQTCKKLQQELNQQKLEEYQKEQLEAYEKFYNDLRRINKKYI